MTDQKKLIEQDYRRGMKYKDIAAKYSIDESTIKTWAKENSWSRDGVANKSCTEKAAEELKDKLFESVDKNEELTEKQKLFCIFYLSNFNATQAYLKVYGGSYVSAQELGSRLLRKAEIQAEISKLKEETRKYFEIEIADYINYLLKIVGARLTDYVEFGNVKGKNFVRLKNSDSVDDSALAEIKNIKGDISIKLEDKKWAWEKLAKIFGFDEDNKTNAPIVIAGENELED